jgi:hypothetical protein
MKMLFEATPWGHGGAGDSHSDRGAWHHAIAKPKFPTGCANASLSGPAAR